SRQSRSRSRLAHSRGSCPEKKLARSPSGSASLSGKGTHMLHAVKSRVFLLLTLITLSLFALPALADNVTISGNVTFASLDGSALDHDHTVNGVFTVNDGDLTVLGTINCNDDGPGANSACA